MVADFARFYPVSWKLELALSLICILLGGALFSLHSRRPRPLPKPHKPLTVRVRLPPDVTDDQLCDELQSLAYQKGELITTGDNILQFSSIREDAQETCATVTFQHRPLLLKSLEYEPVLVLKSIYAYDIQFQGITLLYNGNSNQKPLVDVVAVPGLGSHPLGTWKARKSVDVWLRDFLPHDVPNIRVLIYGYDTALARSNSKQSIVELAEGLLECLKTYRSQTHTCRRPMIFIGHSLGGLLVKEALALASRCRNDNQENFGIHDSCYGLILFGVPNLGLRNEQLLSMVKGQPNKRLIDDLVVDKDSEPSPFLRLLLQHFSDYSKDQNIHCISFYEQRESPTVVQNRDKAWARTGPKVLMVTKNSATSVGLSETFNQSFPLDTDHSDLVKFESKHHHFYCQVMQKIKDFVAVAPPTSIDDLTKDEKACLQSLAFPEMESRELKVDSALTDTCTWIFDRPEYRSWHMRQRLNEHQGLLWIKGKPGSGKSTLMKETSKKIRAEYPQSKSISFFFNARGALLEKEPMGMFRSLLHKLLQKVRPLPQEFLTKFRLKRDTLKPGWDWELEELRNCFSSLATNLQYSPLIIFIDALDECKDSDVRSIVSYFEKLTLSAILSGQVLNICLSSRHYPHISVAKCFEIVVETWNQPDISKYIESELSLHGAKEMELKNGIIEKASGVFLWVVLVVRTLHKVKDEGGTIKSMQSVLESVPGELEELFAAYFKELSVDDRQSSLRLMQWVLFAQKCLSLTELKYALHCSVEHPYKSAKALDEFVQNDVQMEKAVRALSKGLVEVKAVNYRASFDGCMQIVQFIHESVRDFLLHRNGLKVVDPSLNEPVIGQSQDQITKGILNYLSMTELRTYPVEEIASAIHRQTVATEKWVEVCSAYPLLKYAVRYMFVHAAQAESRGVKQKYPAQLLFWNPESIFPAWRRFSNLQDWRYYYRKKYGTDTTFLHVAAEENLLSCVEDLLDSGVSPNLEGGNSRYALITAANHGREEVVQLLLARGANVDAMNQKGFTALHLALKGEYENIARLLLERGANINPADSSGDTPLHLALRCGYENIVQLLLERGANINPANRYGETPIHVALKWGHENIVQQLLERGANINSADFFRDTPLHLALRCGCENIVRLLLERGANINPANSFGETPIHLTLKWGHENIVQLLLERGANINPADFYGHTPLHLALRCEFENIIQLSFEQGADIDVANRDKKPPLYLAVEKKYRKITQLVELGANLNAANIDKTSPLHLAKEEGYGDITQLLVEREADVNATNIFSEPGLHPAARNSNDPFFRYLLEPGAEIDGADDLVNTPLFRAVSRANQDAVSLLVKAGADSHMKNNSAETPLHQAAQRPSADLLRLILDAVDNVGVVDEKGRTALHLAARSGFEDAIKLLLDRGADINAADYSGATPLYHAVERHKVNNSREDVIRLLLERGADPNARNYQDLRSADKSWETVLHLAVMCSSEALVELLLDRGANPDALDGEKRTALHWAAAEGFVAVVRLLLDRGANPDAVDGKKMTAFHWAAAGDFVAVVKLLLDRGADPDVLGGNKTTALHWTAVKGSVAAARLLLDRGANPDALDGEKMTALHWTAIGDFVAMVKLLLDRRADPDVLDGNKMTALHWAAAGGCVAVVRLLRERGADLHAVDVSNKTPLQWAAQYEIARRAAGDTAESGLVEALQDAYV